MTFAEITSYFERIAISNKKIQASYVGDYDDIYKIQANPDEYTLPCLWIESTEMTPVGDPDSVRERWNRGLVVLYKGDPQDKETNKYQIEQSFRVARSILYKILKDAEDMRIRFSIINKAVTQIDPIGSDYLVGWRIEIEIEVIPEDDCYDPDDWDESIEVTNMLSFMLSKTEPGYHAAIVDTLTGSWTYEWRYSIENGEFATANTEDLDIETAQSNIYVILQATHSSSITRKASAFLTSSDIKTKSVPYLYNKYRK